MRIKGHPLDGRIESPEQRTKRQARNHRKARCRHVRAGESRFTHRERRRFEPWALAKHKMNKLKAA